MKIFEARTARKLSQEKLAKISGVAQATISLVERGLTSPNASTRRKLEKVLGRRISWFHTKGQRVFRPTGKGAPLQQAEGELRRALYSINLLTKDEQREFLKIAKKYLKELAKGLNEQQIRKKVKNE